MASALQFLQDDTGGLSMGRLAQLSGVILGFVYLMLNPSDGNFSVYMMACTGGFLVSKGADVLGKGGKNV